MGPNGLPSSVSHVFVGDVKESDNAKSSPAIYPRYISLHAISEDGQLYLVLTKYDDSECKRMPVMITFTWMGCTSYL